MDCVRRPKLDLAFLPLTMGDTLPLHGYILPDSVLGQKKFTKMLANASGMLVELCRSGPKDFPTMSPSSLTLC
jgi:hypothetical protein